MTKMTKKVALNLAIEALMDNDEAVEVLQNMVAQLEKRNSAERKPTKTQVENASLKEEFLTFVKENGAVRASEVAAHFGVSGQKASALLKQLVDNHEVEKVVEKRVTYFTVEGV